MIYTDDRDFKNTIVDYFEHTTKTSWGKNEIVKEIKDMWIWFLEQTIENTRRSEK